MRGGESALHEWTEQSSRITINFISIAMGNDLCVVISGGDVPHLGAVAVSEVRASMLDPSHLSASTSVITRLGHKEDLVSRRVGEALAAKLNKNVVVCCGIHVDNITQSELGFVAEAVDRFCQTYPARQKYEPTKHVKTKLP